MKSKANRFISLILAAFMVVTLGACGSGGTTSSTGGASSAAKSNTGTEDSSADTSGGSTDSDSGGGTDSDIDTSQALEITMLVLGNKPTNGRMEAAIAAENEILKAEINTTVKLQYIEWADWQTNYQLALASGDTSIDLIITASDWLYAWPSVRKGAFMPLSEELLSTYAPKTWAAVTPENWDECSKDGSIWFIPEDQFTQWTNHGFYYRNDWAAEAGITKPITDFEELEVYLKYIADNKDGVIPWDISGTNQAGLMPGYIQNKTDGVTILGTDTGNFAIYYYKQGDPYNVYSPMAEGQEFEDFAVMMKRWAEQNFWREDVLNYQGETRDLMYAGSSGSDQHHVNTFVTTARPNMDIRQPGSDLQMFYWGQGNGNYNRDLVTHGAMAVNASSKNPERALMVYDMIRNNEEVYRLHNMGIEETDYIVNGDGTMGRPEGWDQTTDALDTNFWAGRMDEFELDDEFWYKGKDEVYADLEGDAKSYALGKFAFDPTNVAAQIAAIADVCATHIPSIVYGKVDNPVTAVAEFRQALKDAGYETVLAEIQAQLDVVKAEED